jgi:6-pyruvoyltetrahydropterin/6-carboxytetrahydropterin synthase
MADVLLTKRIEFAAAHRYENPAWDPERNRAVFGACSNAPGHGHNYLLEVTIAGPVDTETGMVVNLTDLKKVLEEVLEDFDHKHLNLDTPFFHDLIPTTENIALVLWGLLAARGGIGRLQKVRLFEDEDLYAEVTASMAGTTDGSREARLVRRYHFAAAHRLYIESRSKEENRRQFGPCAGEAGHGHNYVVEVEVRGKISRETGMVIDLPLLDRLVQEQVLQRFDRQDLSRDAAFTPKRPASGQNLVQVIWELLSPALGDGRLERVRLIESRDSSYECTATGLGQLSR